MKDLKSYCARRSLEALPNSFDKKAGARIGFCEALVEKNQCLFKPFVPEGFSTHKPKEEHDERSASRRSKPAADD